MGLDRWFGRKKDSTPTNTPQSELQEAPKKDERAERQEGRIQAEIRFTFFNRPQSGRIGGDSLAEIADKVGKYVAELEMGPSDSTVKNFSITIPGHPDITSFQLLMQHATKVE